MSTSGQHGPVARRALTHRTKTVVLGTVLASTALAGCSIDLNAIPAAAFGALVPFDACDEALDYLHREAGSRVGPYGLEQGGYAIPLSGGVEDSAGAEQAPEAAPRAPGSTDYSGTTNQEVGVDEADTVKTDGEYIYTVVDGTLRVTDVRDGAPEIVGELKIAIDVPDVPDGPIVADMSYAYGTAQLLLKGDTALVLLTQPRLWPGAQSDRVMAPGWSQSVVIAVDLSDPTAPQETARLAVDGDYLSARLIDGTARVVVRSMPMLPFEQPYSEAPDADWEELGAAATSRNREIVEESTIDQWLPSYTLDIGGEETSGQLVACENVSHPVDFSGFNMVNVLTIPLVGGSSLDDPMTASVLGDGEIVYASTDRLYVVTNRWEEIGTQPVPPGIGAMRAPAPTSISTGIHAFDLTGDGAATHVASGEVDGRVIGQYALSEHEGVLRVATTEGDMWGWGSGASESFVTTLAERDGELVELGSLGGLGKDEQIYAVRYLGDTAYVVTFRQTDPLYVLDLSDPTNPRATGELKISGYSSYLHPFGEGRLIGVGQEAKQTGTTIGLQVSLFDTADPAAPVKIDGEVLRNASSEAEYDPHAFLAWEPTSQVMVPVMSDRRSGLLVLTVTADGLVQDGLVPAADGAGIDQYMTPMRTVVVDDRLYTVWGTGVQANDLDTLEPLGWASFA